MAPRFKQLLFQTYSENSGANAFIGFPGNLFDLIYPFRDALRDEFEKTTEFIYRTNLGVYKEIDVSYLFFEIKDADMIEGFYSKPWPGCWSYLLHTRRYREYKAEGIKVEQLIKIKITTSHDYPCITIDSSALTESTVAEAIVKVAHDLKLDIATGKFPYRPELILTSNNTFDALDQRT